MPKSHIRIESYGTIDELNSWIGVVSDHMDDHSTLQILKEIQNRLFTIGSSLACDPEKEPKLKIPDLKEYDVELLEKDGVSYYQVELEAKGKKDVNLVLGTDGTEQKIDYWD